MEENTYSELDGFFRPPELEHIPIGELSVADYCALQVLKHAKLLIPCKANSKGMSIRHSMLLLKAENGEIFLPAFTCPEELDKWPFEKDGAALFSYDDIKYRVIDDPRGITGIIINPFGDLLALRLEVIRGIDAISQGLSFTRMDHSRNMRLSKPDLEFSDLTEELRNFCKTRENIYRVYLLLAQEPDDIEPHPMLLIDFDGERVSLFPEMARVVQPHIKLNDNFEIMKADYELLQSAASLCKPIYSKHE